MKFDEQFKSRNEIVYKFVGPSLKCFRITHSHKTGADTKWIFTHILEREAVGRNGVGGMGCPLKVSDLVLSMSSSLTISSLGEDQNINEKD